MLFTTWNVAASQILSGQELATVLRDLKRHARRLAIVRRACCRRLRASQIGVLTLGGVRVEHAKLKCPTRAALLGCGDG